MKKKILYIGGFQLPDKNAAAFRVLSNAKVMRDLGYEVYFINALEDIETEHWIVYEDFRCYEYKKENIIKYLLSCKKIKKIIQKNNIDIVIAYNFPSIALNRLRLHCNRNKIKCLADVTEWYMPVGNIIFRIIKSLDTEYRMRIVHPKMDGIIAISEFLFQFYKNKVKTIKIPPLVDISENKWNIPVSKQKFGLKLIYAGSPSNQKERLDLIINVVESLNKYNIRLDLLGITREQYNNMYQTFYIGNKVNFFGHIPNNQAVRMIKEADYSIILRDNNKVVNAGFPTKLVESISCGTPVIANQFSNIIDYLNSNNSYIISNPDDFSSETIENLYNLNCHVDKTIFDYRKYIPSFAQFLNDIFSI